MTPVPYRRASHRFKTHPPGAAPLYASAAGTPTLPLFGPGEPGRYHPWGVQAR